MTDRNPCLRDILNRSLLGSMAGSRSFSRGEDYFEAGRVQSLAESESAVSAKVIGEQQYEVKLWVEDDELLASCTCPMFAKGNFCKHCVAVGLALTEPPLRQPQEAVGKVSAGDIREYVQGLENEALVDLVLQRASEDEHFRSRLELKAGRAKGKGIDVTRYRANIRAAVWSRPDVNYYSMPEYASELNYLLDSLDDLLNEGFAPGVIELSEYFLKQIESRLGSLDDSDGYMGGVIETLEDLHHKACIMAKPDPEMLARRLFEWELRGEWDTFAGAAERYAGVLGESGLAVYRELAEAEWAKVPQLRPGDARDEELHTRFRLTRIMETLAKQSGDVEDLVRVLSRDLSVPYWFLKIGEAYRLAGEVEKAIEWAERGLAQFPERPDRRLREFLAEEYHKKGRHQEAMELVWAEYVERPNLERYELLKLHAERVGEWPSWRKKGLELLQGRLAEGNRREESYLQSRGHFGGSELVRILLWEGEVEEAWTEATKWGCSREQWLELARRREHSHPLDALRVYQASVEPLVEEKTTPSYEQAVELIQRIGKILLKLGRGSEFGPYVESIRTAHRRKRSFVQILDQMMASFPNHHSEGD